MAITVLNSGDEISVTPLNNNFNYLNSEVTSLDLSVGSLQSNIQSLNTNLGGLISKNETDISNLDTRCDSIETSITNINEDIEEIEEKVNRYSPTLVQIVDWDEMQRYVQQGKNIRETNATTGFKYYDGDQLPANNNECRRGDIKLKTDFTDFPKIMITFTNATGAAFYHTTVWDTWELDYILSTLPNVDMRVDILKKHGYYATESYWGIFGYNYTSATFTAKTTKKHLMCNDNKNYAAIIDVYGLTTSVIDAYIVGSSTEFTSGWLSETDGGDALIPAVGTVYIIQTNGTYKNKTYLWDGTTYKEVDAILS